MSRLLTENTSDEVNGMRTGYEVLGNYIRLVDKRNRDLSITNLLGVSIEKRFIPSIANIIGTDLSNYKVVQTGQFAYGPVTSRNGEKISIAYLNKVFYILAHSINLIVLHKMPKPLPESHLITIPNRHHHTKVLQTLYRC